MILVPVLMFAAVCVVAVVSYDGMRHHRNKHTELLEMAHRQAIEMSGALLAANEAHTRSIERVLGALVDDRVRLLSAALMATDPQRAQGVAVMDRSAPTPRAGTTVPDLYEELLRRDGEMRAQADEFRDDEGQPIVPIGMGGNG